MDLRLGVCNRVPRGEDGGYKVDCSADGSSGVYSVCSDSTCANCSLRTPFSSDQCMANPPAFGSASVAIRCPRQGAFPAAAFGRAAPLIGAPAPAPALVAATPSIAANASTSSGALPASFAAAAGLAAATAALVAAALAL